MENYSLIFDLEDYAIRHWNFFKVSVATSDGPATGMNMNQASSCDRTWFEKGHVFNDTFVPCSFNIFISKTCIDVRNGWCCMVQIVQYLHVSRWFSLFTNHYDLEESFPVLRCKFRSQKLGCNFRIENLGSKFGAENWYQMMTNMRTGVFGKDNVVRNLKFYGMVSAVFYASL